MNPNITDFLYSFSNNPDFYLNLPVLWSVTIDGVTENAINQVLENADEIWRANTSPIKMSSDGKLLVAQEVSLPSESSNFSSTEFGNGRGGYLPSYVLNNRSNFLERQFSINFLETEMDIEHNFFRPWLIALSIKGLIEYGQTLKATIDVRQFSNSGYFIKGFRFNKAFPTAIEAYSLNYENTDFPIKSVTFACQNYEQLYYNS